MSDKELSSDELKKVSGGAKKGQKASFSELSNISRFSELGKISLNQKDSSK